MVMLWDLEGRPCTSLKLIGEFDMTQWEERVHTLVGLTGWEELCSPHRLARSQVVFKKPWRCHLCKVLSFTTKTSGKLEGSRTPSLLMPASLREREREGEGELACISLHVPTWRLHMGSAVMCMLGHSMLSHNTLVFQSCILFFCLFHFRYHHVFKFTDTFFCYV